MPTSSQPTPPTLSYQPRDLALLAIGGSNHPAVVIYVEADRLTVIYGTGTDRDIPERVVVEPVSRNGKALRLTKRTHFYGSNTRLVTQRVLTRVQGRCPPELYLDLRELADLAVASFQPAILSQGIPADAQPPAAKKEGGPPK